MRASDQNIYRCVGCRGALRLDAEAVDPNGDVEKGALTCTVCGRAYRINSGIPRFVSTSNYADSFGFEWTSFPRTQLDTNWQALYTDRFQATCEFDHNLSGQTVLEAGCGPGNFTGIILDTGAHVFSFDLSNAIDQCLRSHATACRSGQLSISQADILSPPFALASFDKVICLGVIQHCPEPEKAFKALIPYLKPGGEVVVDCYLKLNVTNTNINHAVKHALRIVTKRLPRRFLLSSIRATISVLYDFKAALNRIPMVGSSIQRLIPIGKLQRHDWTPKQMKEIKTLNVFDMLSPKHDHPQSLESVRRWIADENLELIKCNLGHNGINAKARKPALVELRSGV